MVWGGWQWHICNDIQTIYVTNNVTYDGGNGVIEDDDDSVGFEDIAQLGVEKADAEKLEQIN